VTILSNIGRGLITAALTGTGYTVAKWTAWGLNTGNTAESVTNTALDSEVNLNGTSGTARSGTNAPTQVTTTVTNDTFQVVQTLTASGTFTVAEAGLFDAPTSGNMILRGVFAGIPLSPGDSISLTFRLQFL